MVMSIIFDMDGVIVDSHEAHVRTWKRVLVSLGKSVSDADLDFVRQGRKRAEILQHLLGDLKDTEIQTICHTKDLLFRYEMESIRVVPGARELLQELHRACIPVALASCGSRARVHHLLSHLKLRDYFTAVVTGDDVTLGKPAPEIFHRAVRQMRVHPAESVAFEDSISGVQAAKAAGMKCIGIGDCKQAPILLQSGANCVLPNFVGISWIKIQKLFALSTNFRNASSSTPSLV